VSNGTLKLLNKKESRGGQAWTSANIWTKQFFKYGYYECRYKYASATGLTNSFGLLSENSSPSYGKKFEININTGHFPSEVNTSFHNWSDETTNTSTGEISHPFLSKSFNFSSNPDVNIPFETPIKTRKIRLLSNYPVHFHIQEFRIFNVNSAGYPNVLSATADKDVAGLVNYARDPLTTISSSGVYGTGYEAKLATDGGLTYHWVSQDNGVKWIQFDFPEEKSIGCIQFVSGWFSGGVYNVVIDDYVVQYFDGTDWVDIQAFDASNHSSDFGKLFHTYGLNWTADSLTYYHNGKAIRSIKNDDAKSEAPLFLSSGITPWAGNVTDAINGTQMEVDYIRVYEPVTTTVVRERADAKVNIKLQQDMILIDTELPQKITIFTMNGLLLKSCEISQGNNVIPFSRKGIFIIRLQSRLGVVTRKIFVFR